MAFKPVRAVTLASMAVAALLYGGGYFDAQTPPRDTDAAFLVGGTGATAGQVDRRPSDERQFLAAVNDHRGRFNASTYRTNRANALCAAKPTPVVQNWVGVVDTFSATDQGTGVLSVAIGDGVLVRTWSNAVSDMGDLTMLQANTLVLAIATNAAIGQLVTFSGTLIPSRPDCFKDTGVTESGTMADPEFIFRFTTLRELE